MASRYFVNLTKIKAMGLFDFIFGNKKKQIQELMSRGAIIVDVRTQQEWNQGHIKSARHIELPDLKNKIETLRKLNKPIITCCASGMRSAQAAQFLKKNHIEAVNGGGWQSLNKKL